MIDGTNGLLMDSMQLMRIEEHPIEIDENLIVIDNLEAGTLRLYEHTNGSLNVQQLFIGYGNIKGAVLVGEIIINALWKEEGVFIHKIFCEYGYEKLVNPMINQILYFTNFYDCYNSVGISDKEYENSFPYAKETLSKFHKINRVYEYSILSEA